MTTAVRRTLGVLVCLLGALPACRASDPPHVAPQGQRSVLLITIDTLRAGYLGAYGFEGPVSPNIDALARQGVVFERAIAASSATAPAHATIMTSLPAHRHAIGPRNGRTRLDGELTLAQVLKDAGYETAAFVGNVVLKRRIGLDAGFDVYDDELPTQERNRPFVFERVAEDTTRRAVAWLQQPRDAHFFLWVHYQDPHGPYDPPAELLARLPYEAPEDEAALPVLSRQDGRGGIPAYQAIDDLVRPSAYRHRYAGEVLRADIRVGELLAAARTAAGEDGLVVLLTADHGEAMGEGGVFFAHGHTTTPDMSHVPFILEAPGLAPARRAELVGHVDVMPTLLELAGHPVPEVAEGVALGPVLTAGAPIPPRLLYCDVPGDVSAYREDEFLNLRLFVGEGLQPPRWRARGYRWSPDGALEEIPADRTLLPTLREYLEGAVPPVEAEPLVPDEEERLRALGYLEPEPVDGH